MISVSVVIVSSISRPVLKSMRLTCSSVKLMISPKNVISSGLGGGMSPRYSIRMAVKEPSSICSASTKASDPSSTGPTMSVFEVIAMVTLVLVVSLAMVMLVL